MNQALRADIPAPLPGFENINRFRDRRDNSLMAKILPGEYYVTTQEEVVATVLGSCISVCIRDPQTGVGGMNHFMLPEKAGTGGRNCDFKTNDQAMRYGIYAMEHMINDILKHGGRRKYLEVKVCGGGRIIKSMTDIGSNNIRFVRNYLQVEGYRIASEDVGDIYPRKVRYYPRTGRLMIKKMHNMHNRTVVEREVHLKAVIEADNVSGDVELF